ncbi:MAG TPA: AraC family transcriptional regulator [Casimicrobiaceae bacterium]
MPLEQAVNNSSRQAALSRSHANPFHSSRSRGWNGIVVEVFRARNVDFLAQYSEHVVSMLLRGPIDLLQGREGHVQQRIMHAGDIIVTPMGEPKRLRHRDEAEILKLRIAPSFLEGLVDDADVPERGVQLLDNFGTRDPYIEGIARALLAESRAPGLASQTYVESLCNQLGVHLLRQYSSFRKTGANSPARLARHKLERATDYINDNLREDLTLETISRTLSMSPYHFAHVFKQTVGLTPHRYVVERRMERAKSLLQETTLPIVEIAQQVGYSNQSHFSTVFHRLTGRTPRRYRHDV